MDSSKWQLSFSFYLTSDRTSPQKTRSNPLLNLSLKPRSNPLLLVIARKRSNLQNSIESSKT
ncbi:hypothetical protein ACN4EE_22975, partial [Geminocystis sp. CENA526]|uniref:hypothetical protein n=1 Tax=Geminocystis sp. CENA526 TaxID=1355871 RepID=UPI003D6F2D11